MKNIISYISALALLVFFTYSSSGQNRYLELITDSEISPNKPIHGIAKDSIGYI